VKLIILDRDGVINEDSDQYIKSIDEWMPIPGSLEAIARLNQADYRVVVATNQSGVARGLFGFDTLNRMHTKMLKMLADVGGEIDGIFFCPHTPEENCECRKPKAGLLLDIAKRFDVDLTGVPVIGDSLRDLEAARLVNAAPILVRTGKGERTLAKGEGLDGVPVYDDLAGAVDAILKSEMQNE